MQLISCHDGRLLTLDAGRAGGPRLPPSARRTFSTGLAALDALPPGGAFARGAVHEILSDPADADGAAGAPLFFAMLLARATLNGVEGGAWSVECESATAFSPSTLHAPPSTSSAVIWCDPAGEIYPPALAAHGIPLERLFLLQRLKSPAEQAWAVAECLRCKGVAAVVARMVRGHRLTRLETRRLQLAAERGGGAGLLLRRAGTDSPHHAAATRWLVRPAPGERAVQRWSVQLVHGHGGRVGQTVLLEHHRDTNLVRAADPLVRRPGDSTFGEIRRYAAG